MPADSNQKWLRRLLALAAVLIVAAISTIIALSGRQDPVLEPVPKEVITELPDGPGAFDPDSSIDDSGQRSGGVLINPSEILAENVATGFRLPPVVVTNRSAQRQRIAVDFLPVDQMMIGGAPIITNNQAVRAAGERLVRIDRRRFSLAPGQSRPVVGTIISRPDSGIIIGSIAFTVAGPRSEPSEPEKNNVSTSIQSNLQLNAMTYLLWPEAVDGRAYIERVRGRQSAPGQLSFTIRARGGPGVSTPQGAVAIVNSNGETVATLPVAQGQRIFPDSQRELITEGLVEGLTPGLYEARGRISSGGVRQQVRWPFRIDVNGQLPTPAALLALRAAPVKARPGESVTIDLDLENSGTKNFAPQGALRLYAVGSDTVLDQRPLKFGALAPGDEINNEITIAAPQEPGNYEVVVDLEAEDGALLDQRVVSFVVNQQGTPEASFIDSFRDWISDNPLAAVAIAVLVIGLGLATLTGGVLLYRRRRENS